MEKLLSFIALVDAAVLIGVGSSCLPNQDCFIVAATGICILVALIGYCIFSAFVYYIDAKEHARLPSSPLPLPLHSPLASPQKREMLKPLPSASPLDLPLKRQTLPLSSSPNNPSRIQEIRVLP